MVVGTTTYDYALMLGIPVPAYIAHQASQSDLYIHGLFDATHGVEATGAVLEAYKPNNEELYHGSNVAAMASFQGDNMLMCHSQEMANIATISMGTLGEDLRVQLFTSAGDLAITNGLLEMAGIAGTNWTASWASHMAEHPFVFGKLGITYGHMGVDHLWSR